MDSKNIDIQIGDYLLNDKDSSSGWIVVAITPEGYAIAHEELKTGRVISREDIKHYKVARRITPHIA